MNKTIYQVLGASLTFPESKKMLEWVEETVAKQSQSMRESMEKRGYSHDSNEAVAMIDKIRIHTLKAIAKAKPEFFEFSTNQIGDKLLAI
jgi:hypothetical protein